MKNSNLRMKETIGKEIKVELLEFDKFEFDGERNDEKCETSIG